MMFGAGRMTATARADIGARFEARPISVGLGSAYSSLMTFGNADDLVCEFATYIEIPGPPQPPSLGCPACSGIMLVVERLTCGQLHFRSSLTLPNHGGAAMTLPESWMTHSVTNLHAGCRVLTRKASVCSSPACISPAAPSQMPIGFASYPYRVRHRVRLPFGLPTIAPALAPQTSLADIEIP